MKIEHVALWVSDLERMRQFYVSYFGARAGQKYVNQKKGFASYFLSFDSGARLEIMHQEGIPPNRSDPLQQATGYVHLAMSAGSKQAVNSLTERLVSNDFQVLDGPRTTGDGYYESVVLDPEGNRIEITE